MLNVKQLELFPDLKIYAQIDKHGDSLAALDAIMDWTPFVLIIDEARPDKSKGGKGGRPPVPSVVMLKGLLIGELYHLSDDQIEYQINDRASFKRFCGLGLTDASPDANSFWALREKLRTSGKYEELFKTLLIMLSNVGLQYSKCAIVDSTFVDAPRRRNLSSAQEKALKEHRKTGAELPFEIDKEQVYNVENNIPEEDRVLSHILRQTDLDAVWAKKGEEVHFGYKDHVAVDAATKLIIEHKVTEASAADVKHLIDIVPERTEVLYDDSGYTGAEYDEQLNAKCPDIDHRTAKKGQKNKPLTNEQKEYNRNVVSRVRARAEHVFGRMTYCMGGLFVRCIGIERARCKITLRDLAYNLSRYASLVRLKKAKSMV
jgi:IS5 family transposase